MALKYLNDFMMGQTFGSCEVAVIEDDAVQLATQFDPKPLHLAPRRHETVSLHSALIDNDEF